MHPTAIACTAILSLLLFGLGFAVSGTRAKSNMPTGCPDDPAHILYRMIRAHGNTVEYAPMFAVLFLYLGSHQPAAWVLWFIALATVSRIAIVVGFLTCETMAKVTRVRFLGAFGTYLSGVALSIAALVGV